jgi:hypothetical protein
VTLEILDASGTVIETMSSVAAPAATAPSAGIPRVSPLWEREPQRFDTSPGMHRVIWTPVQHTAGGGDFFGRVPTLLSGTFTARLTANGQLRTQTFNVLPDPRPAPQ